MLFGSGLFLCLGRCIQELGAITKYALTLTALASLELGVVY